MNSRKWRQYHPEQKVCVHRTDSRSQWLEWRQGVLVRHQRCSKPARHAARSGLAGWSPLQQKPPPAELRELQWMFSSRRNSALYSTSVVEPTGLIGRFTKGLKGQSKETTMRLPRSISKTYRSTSIGGGPSRSGGEPCNPLVRAASLFISPSVEHRTRKTQAAGSIKGALPCTRSRLYPKGRQFVALASSGMRCTSWPSRFEQEAD